MIATHVGIFLKARTMGRLTDDLLAMFGLKPSDRVSLPAGNSKAPSTEANIRASQESGSVPADDKAESGEDHRNKEIADDCLSCKVIGVGTLLGATVFVCYFTLKNAKQYTGLKRVAAYGQGISLVTCKSWLHSLS